MKRRVREVSAITVQRNPDQLSFSGDAAACCFGAAVAARELLDATRGIDEFLFAREKRMASGANADFNITPRRARVVNRAASAADFRLVIFRMNGRFHVQERTGNLCGKLPLRKR